MKDLIIYKDEDDSKQVIFVDLLEVGTSFVKFKTAHNSIITIPINRVIKIKQRGEGVEWTK